MSPIRLQLQGSILGILLPSLRVLLGVSILWGVTDSRATSAKAEQRESVEFFEKQIRPLLAKQCYSCHGPGQQLSDLCVDSREGLLQGGKRGPALLPGNPEESSLMAAVRHDGLQMPPTSKLTDAEIQALEEWVRLGAP